MEEINIKEFLDYIKKYTVIILVMAVIVACIAFIYDFAIKTPLYTTYTTLVLVKNENNTTTSETTSETTITSNDVMLNQKLVATYRRIIKSKLVLEQVIKKLDLVYSIEELQKNVGVEAYEDTEILRISVTDESAETAARIANTIADIFLNEIIKIYNMNNVTVLDAAEIPLTVSNNTTKRDIVLVVAITIVGLNGVVFVLFYFDDRIKNKENLENDIKMPVIAKIFNDKNGIDLVVSKKPKALTSESIRTLRTNLQFSSVDNELKTILVTSTLPAEGKSFVCANLATSFAQAGKKVLLVDCDLRKGRQHEIFKVQNKLGLSNILINSIEDYKDYINDTNIANLYVISRGPCPPNPSELLGSKKNSLLIEILKRKFDIIIFDGAPINGLSDSLILSKYVDKVLLVCAANHTPKSDFENARKTLENVNAPIAGCVLNRIDVKNRGYGYNNYYYYYYGESDKKK